MDPVITSLAFWAFRSLPPVPQQGCISIYLGRKPSRWGHWFFWLQSPSQDQLASIHGQAITEKIPEPADAAEATPLGHSGWEGPIEGWEERLYSDHITPPLACAALPPEAPWAYGSHWEKENPRWTMGGWLKSQSFPPPASLRESTVLNHWGSDRSGGVWGLQQPTLRPEQMSFLLTVAEQSSQPAGLPVFLTGQGARVAVLILVSSQRVARACFIAPRC